MVLYIGNLIIWLLNRITNKSRFVKILNLYCNYRKKNLVFLNKLNVDIIELDNFTIVPLYRSQTQNIQIK